MLSHANLKPFHVVFLLAVFVFAVCLVAYEADGVTMLMAAGCVAVAVAVGMFDDKSKGNGDGGSSSSSSSSSRPAAAGPIVMDPELYTMRARGCTKHLALRRDGLLLRLVRRAASIGSRRGNSASGDRAIAALEDFFMRYHWALLRADDAILSRPTPGPDTTDLISRTLATLSDTRTIALNCIQEITFNIPLAMAGPVTRAVSAVREETLMCLEVLVDRLAQSDPVAAQVASAAWRGPTPHDPLRAARDAVGYKHQLW